MDQHGQNTMKDSLNFLTILQKLCKSTLAVKYGFRWQDKAKLPKKYLRKSLLGTIIEGFLITYVHLQVRTNSVI